MRVLVLGGTVFLGRALARHARDAGHDVTCAARGTSGAVVDGVRFVRVDRDDPDGLAPLEGAFDAVVDVSRRPRHVRHAARSLAGRVGHLTFVSSGSVYTDVSTPGQRVDRAPVLPPATPDNEDPEASAEAYGACKVACERTLVEAFGEDRVFVCRAGLIVGPEDPIGRFEYWIRRLSEARERPEVAAPGAPEDLVQLIDVRDLAAWIVEAGERGLAGTLDGTGVPISRAEFLAAVAEGVGAPPGTTYTYLPPEFLAEHQVNPWAGPRSLPVWLPLPQYAGFLSRDVTPSLAEGLRTRPLAETARATYTWKAQNPDGGRVMGLTAQEETDLLAAWHANV